MKKSSNSLDGETEEITLWRHDLPFSKYRSLIRVELQIVYMRQKPTWIVMLFLQASKGNAILFDSDQCALSKYPLCHWQYFSH